MGCVGLGSASVRSGCAGDAGYIVKHSRRGNRTSQANPKGRVFKALKMRRNP